MKAIAIILMISLLNACSSLKIYNESNCDVNIQQIAKEIKQQKARISSARITLSEDNNCSVFILHIDKWKGGDWKHFSSSCRILKTVDNIYINTYYRNGVYRSEIDKQIIDKYIDVAIQSFLIDKETNFDSQTLKEIEGNFRYGLDIFLRFRTNSPEYLRF